jgi:two-component system, LuxR family, sensor kinase FixL
MFQRNSLPVKIALTIAASGAALLITDALWPQAERPPMPFFVVAVVATSWFGGFWLGIIVSVLAFVAQTYLLPDQASVKWEDTWRLTEFLLISIVISSLSSAGRRTAAALRESEARSRAILETAADGIITFNEQGKIESLNQTAKLLFGYTDTEAVGREIQSLMAEPRTEVLSRSLRRTGESPQRAVVESRGRTKDGSTFPLDVVVSEVTLVGRKIYTAIFRDLSERKALERQILEISEREQRRIGRDLHDGLGQQLAGIAYKSEALQQRLNTKGAPEAVDVQQIVDLTQGAVDQARGLARGLAPVHLQTQGLGAALHELAASVQATFNVVCRFHGEVSTSIPDETATHLYRICQEAVNNAIRHSNGKQIDIECAESDGELKLVVRDDGLGPPDPSAHKIGMGLQTMNFRAEVVGATLYVRRGHERGTEVVCSLKLNPIQKDI